MSLDFIDFLGGVQRVFGVSYGTYSFLDVGAVEQDFMTVQEGYFGYVGIGVDFYWG